MAATESTGSGIYGVRVKCQSENLTLALDSDPTGLTPPVQNLTLALDSDPTGSTPPAV